MAEGWVRMRIAGVAIAVFVAGCTLGSRPPVCGDEICDPDESNAECPEDCPVVPVCGNLICEQGESSLDCAVDCPPGPTACGNGVCDLNESPTNCPADCAGPVCGDGTCDLGETPSSCAVDCTAPPAGIAGSWNAALGPPPDEIPGTITFTENAGSVTGFGVFPDPMYPFDLSLSGTLVGSTLTATGDLSTQGYAIPATFQGTVTGASIDGMLTLTDPGGAPFDLPLVAWR